MKAIKIKTLILTGLAAALAVTAGCNKQEAKSTAAAQNARSAKNMDCANGECMLPEVAQISELEDVPAARRTQTAPIDLKAGESVIKTVYRKLPGAGKQTDAPVVAKVNQPARPANLQAMAGEEGHFNDVKLPGMAHSDLPEEQPFLVKKFNKSVWPAGMPLEAEIDPDVANF